MNKSYIKSVSASKDHKKPKTEELIITADEVKGQENKVNVHPKSLGKEKLMHNRQVKSPP